MKSDSEKIAFKRSAKQVCVDILNKRIANISLAMDEAQESANNQEKSSVGDKHETSRAISQAEHGMNAVQLAKIKSELQFLETINVEQVFNAITIGSAFEIDDKTFFVSAGLGAITVNNVTVMAISPSSPLFLNLKMKKTGDRVLFQNRELLTAEVY